MYHKLMFCNVHKPAMDSSEKNSRKHRLCCAGQWHKDKGKGRRSCYVLLKGSILCILYSLKGFRTLSYSCAAFHTHTTGAHYKSYYVVLLPQIAHLYWFRLTVNFSFSTAYKIFIFYSRTLFRKVTTISEDISLSILVINNLINCQSTCYFFNLYVDGQSANLSKTCQGVENLPILQ